MTDVWGALHDSTKQSSTEQASKFSVTLTHAFQDANTNTKVIHA